MDTSMGSMTTTKEWEWGPCEANSGIEDPLWGDAVAFLVDDEVQELYDDMRGCSTTCSTRHTPTPPPRTRKSTSTGTRSGLMGSVESFNRAGNGI